MAVSIPAHVKKKLIDEIADLRTALGLMANVPHQQFDWSVGKLWDIWRRELPTVPPPAGMPTPANYEEAQAALDVMLREIGEDAEGARMAPAGSTTTVEPDTGSGKPRTVQPLPPSKPNVKSNVSLDARALAVFIEHSDWTKKRIAKHLGTNEKCLAEQDVDGNLEAWEDD
jgi:hypothetical protein